MDCHGKKGLGKQKKVLSNVIDSGAKIKEFVNQVKRLKGNDKKEIYVKAPDKTFISFVKDKMGFDLTGYKRKIDNYAVKHIFKKHATQKEKLRGQIHITEDDFLFYDDIVTNYDKIAKSHKTKIGRDAIIYMKKYEDTIYVIEEVRNKHKELVPTTMYKTKATTPDASGYDWLPAPRLNVQNVSSLNKSSIPQNFLEKGVDHFGNAIKKVDELQSKKSGYRLLTVSDMTKQIGEITHDFRIGMSQIHEQAGQIKSFLDSNLSPSQSTLLHKALSGDMDAFTLPGNLRETYNRMRDIIDTNADALVKAGALNEKHKIKDYLKRYYEDHLNEGGVIKKMYFDERFRKRKNLTHDERIALGMIEDANFVIPKTLAEQRVQLLKANTLKNVADQFASDVELAGYVRMSDETAGGGIKKYGALAGKYVPEDVANAVKGAGLVKENMGALEQIWYPLIDHIKVNVTVKNPFTHLYNVGSNVMLSFLHGDMTALTKVLHMAATDRRKFDALVKRANKYGLNSYLGEMEKIEPFDLKKEPVVMSILKNAYFSKGSKLGDTARHLYDWEDKIFKIASFYKHLESGMDEKQAFKISQEAYVDYTSPLPGAVRILDKIGLMPFIHYSYKATPMVVKAIAKHPLRFTLMQGAMMGAGASAWLGDNEKENMYKPKWAASEMFPNAFGVKSWVQLGGGWCLNTGRLVPGMRFDGFDTLEFGGGFIGGGINMLGGKTPLGYNIDGKYDSTSMKISKRVLEMAKNYLPPITFGRYGQRVVGKATGLNNPKNYYDEDMSYSEMLIRGAGVRRFNEKKEVISKARAVKNTRKYERGAAGDDTMQRRKADTKYNKDIGKVKSVGRTVGLRLDKF